MAKSAPAGALPLPRTPRTPRLGCLGLDRGGSVSFRRSPIASASASGASLDLTGNGITCLVREVLAQQPEARMVNLRTLLCTGNALQRLDPIICRSLQKLELLCLSGNRIHSLPADIGQLRSLKMLRLESNALSELPWQIGELQQMEQWWQRESNSDALPRLQAQSLADQLAAVDELEVQLKRLLGESDKAE